MCENLVWIGWAFQELSFEFSVGAETPYWGGGGCKWPAMPIFGLGWAIPVKSHLCKFGSDWLSLSRVIVSTNIFLWGRHPLLGWVTFELWGPFLNSDELFQSKVMCGNLVWIGRNRRHVNFEGGYMWPAMPIFELGRSCLDKSNCVKIWFRLVEAFKSYRLEKPNDTRTLTRTKMFKVRSRSSPIGELKNTRKKQILSKSKSTEDRCTASNTRQGSTRQKGSKTDQARSNTRQKPTKIQSAMRTWSTLKIWNKLEHKKKARLAQKKKKKKKSFKCR